MSSEKSKPCMEQMIGTTPIANSSYLKIGSVHHFLCKCGCVDYYDEPLVSLIYHPNHTCSVCDNSYYIDVISFIYDTSILYWKTLNLTYEFEKQKTGWVAKAILRVPMFNTYNQKIELCSIVLVSHSLYYDVYLHTVDAKCENHMPELTKKYLYPENEKPQKILHLCNKILAPMFYEKMIETLPIKLSWLRGSIPTLCTLRTRREIVEYFLKYQELNKFEFYYWIEIERFLIHESIDAFTSFILNHKQEKSLKKAYYLSYKEAIDSKYYDPLPDYIFSRNIKDVNYLLKCIQIPTRIKSALFAKRSIREMELFFDFLKRYYTESSMTKLWQDISHDDTDTIVPDTFRMFMQEAFQDTIAEHFRKPAANICVIHDEFSRINNMFHRLKIENKTFDYEENALNAVGEYEGLDYRLPLATTELNLWAGKLRNCMSSYSMMIHTGESIIYGAFSLKDNKLLHAIEIRNYKLVQVKSFANKSLKEEEMMKIENWFEKAYLI